MTIDDEALSLQKFRMFRLVETSKLKLLAMISDRVTFRPNEVIFEQGADSDAVYMVLDGLFKVAIKTEHGVVDFAEHVSGALLGEAGVLCGQTRMVTIMAETEMTTLRVDRESFLRLMQESPPFNLAVMRELGQQIMDLNNICAQLVLRQPEGVSAVDASRSVVCSKICQ